MKSSRRTEKLLTWMLNRVFVENGLVGREKKKTKENGKKKGNYWQESCGTCLEEYVFKAKVM